jgi:hypothetical protein
MIFPKLVSCVTKKTLIVQRLAGSPTIWEDTMFDEYTTTFNRNFRWVKSDNGTTYLCPAGENLNGASDDILQAICIDESANPQNN